MSKPVDPADLDFILTKLKELRPNLDFRNEKILLTGGTGFFGKWMTQALLKMNDRWSLGNDVIVLSRDRFKTLQTSPWLDGRKDVQVVEADVRTVSSNSKFTTVIHGAATASRALNENDPDEMYRTITEGTQNILAMAAASGCRKFQLVSSGAIYGKQPSEIEKLSENYPSSPDPASAYGRAKHLAEEMALKAQTQAGFQLSIPRCFAFVGPYLPLDIHFAAGNFLRQVLNGEPIEIKGDGTPMRSYLYAADLVVWQLASLLGDENVEVYNLGSDHPVSVRELAEHIHKIGCEVKPERQQMPKGVIVRGIPQAGKPPERYVPSVDKAKGRLGVDVWTDLDSAFRKTLMWNLP